MTENNILNWKDCIISSGSTVSDAILNLEKTGMQICLITNKKNELLGVITDGDIRRSLLDGHNVNSLVDDIMVTRPMIVNEDILNVTAIELMRLNLIRHLPIVNNKNELMGIHTLDQIAPIKKIENTMVIMAGGFGKRLAPYTDECPKPMLLVDDKPMLEHIIRKAMAEGFTNFIISVYYLSEVIKDYFEDGTRMGINITYIKEDSPLGTAGALSIINPMPSSPFVVTNGDVMTDIRYGDILDFHTKKNSTATMAVRLHEWQNPFGVVNTNGINIESFEEKPVYKSNINAGVYVLDPYCLSLLKKDEVCDMPNLFQRVKSAGRSSVAFPMHESWIDVGRLEDLKIANKDNS